jgi:hypothetical protein
MKPPFRLVRATAFSAVCVSLTLAGHWLASGDPLPFSTVLWSFAGVGFVAYLLAGAERSLPVIFGVLLGGQFSLHVFLAHAGGHHGALGATESLSPGMSAAHFGAGILSAIWLRRGERAAWALARRLLRPLLTLVAAVLPPVPAPAGPVPVDHAPARPGTALLRHALVPHGPPVPFPAR